MTSQVSRFVGGFGGGSHFGLLRATVSLPRYQVALRGPTGIEFVFAYSRGQIDVNPCNEVVSKPRALQKRPPGSCASQDLPFVSEPRVVPDDNIRSRGDEIGGAEITPWTAAHRQSLRPFP